MEAVKWSSRAWSKPWMSPSVTVGLVVFLRGIEQSFWGFDESARGYVNLFVDIM